MSKVAMVVGQWLLTLALMAGFMGLLVWVSSEWGVWGVGVMFAVVFALHILYGLITGDGFAVGLVVLALYIGLLFWIHSRWGWGAVAAFFVIGMAYDRLIQAIRGRHERPADPASMRGGRSE